MRPKQPTPSELRDNLLDFVAQHFYKGHSVSFQKDRPRLLKWVVLRLATWLNSRAVTIPPARYEAIMKTVLQDALNLGNVGQITYLPAWLGKVVESHLDHHGEEYYMEGKNLRSQLEQTLTHLGRLQSTAPDPIRQLAQAASLLKSRRAPKPVKTPSQPTLF